MTTPLRPLAVHAVGVAVAYSTAHIVEHGYNRGDQIEWFQRAAGGRPGDSWCGEYLFACLLKAYCGMHNLLTGATNEENRAIMLAHANAMSAETGIPRTGSCIAIRDGAIDHGRWHGKGFVPSIGDIVLFDFPDPKTGKPRGVPHHCAFVRSVLTDGTLGTAEGNTSSGASGSQSDGDGCWLRTRGRSFVLGFVHFE